MADDNTEDIKTSEQEIIRDEQGKFIPGVSGNPGGRPKTKFLTESLIKFLEETNPATNKKRFEDLMTKLATLGYSGNVKAIQEIMDRVEGKATQTLKHEGEVDLNVKKLEDVIDELTNETSQDKDTG